MKNKLKWILGAAAVIAAGTVSYGLVSAGVSTELYKVSKGEITQYLEETAQVRSTDRHIVYIEGSGKVTGIYADVGDMVKQGDLLLALDKTELELQLKNAEAGIAASKAQLAGTELKNYANEIEQARAAANQAKVNFDSAKRSLDNAETLYRSQAMSREEYDRAKDTSDASLAALNAADSQLEDIKKGAPEYLKNGYTAQLKQAEITRDTIANSLGKQEVRAPATGTVVEKLVEDNSPAVPGMAAFIIDNTNNLKLEADILSDDINKVKAGNEVEIRGKPLGNSVLRGKVVKIAPAAKAEVSSLGVSQNRVPVTIEINDNTSLLKPGFSVDVRIITNSSRDTLKVPDSAVFDYKGKSCVFVEESGQARLRIVEKGIENNDYIEILKGLKEGDTVIAEPGNSIREGGRIKPVMVD